MFLEKFNPADVDPLLLVNHISDRDWLFQRLDAYLRSVPPHAGTSFVFIGDKGCGKTILTRAAMRKAREIHSSRVVFIDVNCRDSRTAKSVFGAVALQLVEGLADLRAAGHAVKSEYLNTSFSIAIERSERTVESLKRGNRECTGRHRCAAYDA